MITEVDVWRAANALIRAHGDDATVIAAEMADDLLDQGDLEGQRVLKAVIRAITELRRTTPNEGELSN